MPGPIKNSSYENAQLKPWGATSMETKAEEPEGSIKGHKVKLEKMNPERESKIRKRHKAYLKKQEKQEKRAGVKEEKVAGFSKENHRVSKIHEPRLGEGAFGTVDQRIKAESKAGFFQGQGFSADFYRYLQGDIGRFVVEKTAKNIPGRENNLERDVSIHDDFPPHPNIMGMVSSPSNLKQAEFEHGGVDLRALMKEKEIRSAEQEVERLKIKLRNMRSTTHKSDLSIAMRKLLSPIHKKKSEAIGLKIANLESRINNLKKEAKLQPSMVMETVLQSARGLAHLHQNNIMHRDIKLDNVLIDAKGQVRLGDLGLATKIGKGSDLSGTPSYMAPETATGLKKDKHGKRASFIQDAAGDMWALGAVALDMLNSRQVPHQNRKNVLKELQNAIKTEEARAEDLGRPLTVEQRCMKELVFEVIPRLLDHNYHTRVSSENLVRGLEGFSSRLADNDPSTPDYLR